MNRHLVWPLALASLALAGCEVFNKKGEQAQEALAVNVVGMPIGDFFDRYGRGGNRRTENIDGTLEFEWQSDPGYTRPGPAGQDERICRLHLVVGKGRITSALVVYDAQGKVSSSRCKEIFEGRTTS